MLYFEVIWLFLIEIYTFSYSMHDGIQLIYTATNIFQHELKWLVLFHLQEFQKLYKKFPKD